MLNFAICDDNINILDKLEKMLENIFTKNNFDATVSFKSDNTKDMLDYVSNNKLDVIDILSGNSPVLSFNYYVRYQFKIKQEWFGTCRSYKEN